MGRLAAFLVVLAGCDSLFNLDTVPLPPRGADAAGSDALVPEDVVMPCTPGQKTIPVVGLTAIAAGDIDRNGTSDLAITSTQNPNGDVLVYTIDSTRMFTEGLPLHPGANPVAVAWYAPTAADFPDLIVSARGTNELIVFPNSSGALGVPKAITSATGPTPGLAIADITGEGFPDVIAGTDSQIVVTFGASGGFGGTGNIGIANVQTIVAGQISAEPADDFASSSPTGNKTDVVTGSITGTVTDTPLAMGTTTAGIAIGDFTGDQVPDIATALPTGALIVAPGPTFAARASTAFSAPGPLLALELTGDNHLDLVVGTSTGLWLAPGAGNGTFGGPQQLLSTASAVTAIVTGDFDGDGHADIAAATASQLSVLFECR